MDALVAGNNAECIIGVITMIKYLRNTELVYNNSLNTINYIISCSVEHFTWSVYSI